MNYFIWYLISGIVFLSLFFLSSVLHKIKEGKDTHKLSGIFSAPISKKDRLLEKYLLPVIVSIITIIFWPLVIVWIINEIRLKKKKHAKIKKKIFKVEINHLVDQVSIENIEQKEIVLDPLNAVPNVPFGFLNREWVEFKEKIHPSDEIYSFTAEWHPKYERKVIKSGYVLVQDNKPTNFFISSIKYKEK